MPEQTMSVVERVARALCIAAGHDPDGPTADIYVPGDPSAGLPWAGYRAFARAAIQAMREPSPAAAAEMARVGYTLQMFGAGGRSNDPRCLTDEEMERIGWGDHLHGNPSRWYMPHWRAGIDAALKEGAEHE